MSEIAPIRATTLPARLHHWFDDGWIRSTDLALAALLAEQGGETDEVVLALAALASYTVGAGHTRLRLDELIEAPAMLWSESPATDSDAETPIEWLGALALDTLRVRLTVARSVEAVNAGDAGDTAVDSDTATPLVLQGNALYLRRYWANERLIHSTLEARLAETLPALPGLTERLDGLFPRTDRHPDWQRVAGALATRSRFTLITGGPGTGKTRTVLRLLGLLQAERMDTHPEEPLRIRLAAPTGKAAARLGESISGEVDALPLRSAVRDAIPRSVSTLHRLLGPRPGSRRFRHDRDNPLHADLVVVDEASMIDQELTARLLDALRPETRLVLLGDKDQLASVEAGAVLGELCAGTEQPHYTAETVAWVKANSGDDIADWQAGGSRLQQQIVRLRDSRRFGADSGIGALAEAIRRGDSARANALLDSDAADIQRLELAGANDAGIARAACQGYQAYLTELQTTRPAGDDRDATERWARGVLAAFSRFQVLTTVRHGPLGVSGLNERIAAALQQNRLIDRASGWFEGRPVMITRNDYELGLMNGDIGTCLMTRLPGESGARLRVAFEWPDHRIRLVLPSRLDAVESVFAMTVHKSQGSEFDHVLVVLPEGGPGRTRPELLYTAVTRARTGAVIAHPQAQ
ncbi:exodeoxyribonuclease V subunit alpha [Spiribacter vilamensis]|uniref:RecBCD enzyme subunit RecD n=1 Tax=Spiribacter vilamensis TaxID=531306 RepID=A0A4Q8CZ36_9GAMM|nr:exodeoxyribonuclease V subunit alpha [Spiribacter vilamensis]RZU98263.1 DNA helicase/exodeoxyribonuclease V alpha subunit [Spiribacter vilamensis]